MQQFYFVAFVPDESGYSLFSPDFPEFHSHGNTIDDAVLMARGRLRLCVDAYLKEGRPLPAPCDLETARARIGRLLADIGFAAESFACDCVPVFVPEETEFQGGLVSITLTMPKTDLEELEARAQEQGLSLGAFLQAAVRAWNREKPEKAEK